MLLRRLLRSARASTDLSPRKTAKKGSNDHRLDPRQVGSFEEPFDLRSPQGRAQIGLPLKAPSVLPVPGAGDPELAGEPLLDVVRPVRIARNPGEDGVREQGEFVRRGSVCIHSK